jgi:wobble nucleotide-excising tRNase
MSRIPAIIIFLICSLFVVTISYSQENTLKQSGKQELVLSQADQLILEAIKKTNERIDNLSKEFTGRIDNLSKEFNGRIDNLNGRIDNLSKELNGRIDTLWITMLGGFMGVMAFIGGIVFWDRRTFLKRAREECRQELSADRKTLEGVLAAIRKLSEKSPEIRELLNNFGLL